MDKKINEKQLNKKFAKQIKQTAKELDIKKSDLLDFLKRFFKLSNGLFSFVKIKNFFK